MRVIGLCRIAPVVGDALFWDGLVNGEHMYRSVLFEVILFAGVLLLHTLVVGSSIIYSGVYPILVGLQQHRDDDRVGTTFTSAHRISAHGPPASLPSLFLCPRPDCAMIVTEKRKSRQYSHETVNFLLLNLILSGAAVRGRAGSAYIHT